VTEQNDQFVDRPQASAVRLAFVGVFLPLCWLGMMVVHEGGHVVGAMLTGGRVVKVVLHPLAISRTDVRPNPHPNVVAWCGPIAGVVVPIGLWQATVRLRRRSAYLLRFFAGFCLVANGLYLGVGAFDRVGDAGDLLRSGADLWQLWAFGCVSVVAGFLCWNGQAGQFGFGPQAHDVDPRDMAGVTVALAMLLAAEVLLM